MKLRVLFACSAAVVLCSALPCFASDSPWDGTWKLNREKSKMTGDTWTLTQDPDGRFHSSNASGSFSVVYGCDQKEYPVFTDDTVSCRKISDTVYVFTNKHKGKVTSEDRSVLSENDRVTTDTAKNYRPDGTVSTSVTRSERVGAGKGVVGTWKDVKNSNNLPSVMIMKLSGDTLRTESPAYKSVTTAKLDGSLAKMEGPTTSPDFSLRTKAEGAQKLHSVFMLKGKVVGEEIETLSNDGKTIVSEDWDPGKPEERQTYVFEKQ